MKTNEFIKKVKELGFNVKEKKYTIANETWLIIYEGEHTKCIGVEKNTRYRIDTNYGNFILSLDDDLKWELFNLAIEYARTPVEKRELEKKYCLRLPFLDSTHKYLNIDRDTKEYLLRNKEDFSSYKAQFTQEEIDEMKEKYNLDSFNIVEVEE